MRRYLFAALLLAGCAQQPNTPAPAPVAVAPQNEADLREAGAEILFWSQAQRDANFPAMETLFPGNVVEAASNPSPLPAGEPLDLGPGDPVGTHMAAHNVAGLIVVHDGCVRLERYARGHSAERRYTSFSVAKSLTSTLVGAAIVDGLIASVDDPVTRYIPELAGSAYDGVSVEQLLTMTSGVKWNEDYTDPNSDVARMYAEAPPAGIDPTVAYLRTLPREAEPGTKWVYKTGETNLVGVLVAKVTGRTLADYLSEKVWKPFGMERDAYWMVDGSGQEIGGCCISITLRDYARIGLFVLGGGAGVVPDGWFAAATAAHAKTANPAIGYGYQWWINADGTFQAQGIFGQLIYIDPARRLVVAMSGAWPKASDRTLRSEQAAFVKRIAAAAEGD